MNYIVHGVAKSRTQLNDFHLEHRCAMGFPSGLAVNNLPAMEETREMWVQSLGWEDPLEEGMPAYSSILSWRIPMDRGAWRATVHGVTKSQTQMSK